MSGRLKTLTVVRISHGSRTEDFKAFCDLAAMGEDGAFAGKILSNPLIGKSSHGVFNSKNIAKRRFWEAFRLFSGPFAPELRLENTTSPPPAPRQNEPRSGR